MERIDSRLPPALDDVEESLRDLHGAAIIPRSRFGRRKQAPPGRSRFSAEVLENERPRRVTLDLPIAAPSTPPRSFRVLAVVAAHNEEDVLRWCVEGLVTQGCEVAVIDHASTDDTPRIAADLQARGLIVAHRRVAAELTWPDILNLKVELVDDLAPNWALHSDADEARSSPWSGASLRRGLWAAEVQGSNTIDSTIVNHLPVRGERNGHPDRLPHVDFGLRPGYFMQRKTWRADVTVDLGTSGHHAERADERLFPLNFRCDHYPVRSQDHGRTKILVDRKARWQPDREERSNAHSHYDHVTEDHEFEVRPGILPIASPAWDITNRARLLFRAGMKPSADYRLV